MYVTSYGAVREVTGSMHLLTTDNDRILLDCGMFQGNRKKSEVSNRIMPVDPSIITNIILSHGHVDHCGRIPLLTNKSFTGRVITTRATMDVCDYLLRDCGHIQESDAEYLNYKKARSHLLQLANKQSHHGITEHTANRIKKRLKKDEHYIDRDAVEEVLCEYDLESIVPLYTVEDAIHALNYFEGYPYGIPIEVGTDITCTFYDAGHILGSAFCLLKIKENGQTYRIIFTGDIGRFSKPIVKDPNTHFPEEDRDIDLLIMESTYGDRVHDPVGDLKWKLKEVIEETVERGGSILIPSFAFGRTQEIIYLLHEIYDEGKVPRIPIYIDSPMANHLTKVFGEHPETYDEATHQTFLNKGKNPFLFEQINFVQTVEESMRLLNEEKSHIVISASGMCEAGRILHHLRYKIHNPKNTILLVGYMAQNTLGRRLKEEGLAYESSGRVGTPPMMKFLNKEYPLHAHVRELDGFSGHGDKTEMLRFLKESRLNIKQISLVHGEEDQIMPFKQLLESHGYNVVVPFKGDSIMISS